MTLANQPQQDPLSQLQRLDRQWSAMIAACVLLELATFGMDSPFWQGIKSFNRAGIVAVSSFKFCRYRIGADIRSEIEAELTRERVEQGSLVQRYRYEIQELQEQIKGLTEDNQALRDIARKHGDLDMVVYSLKKELKEQESRFEDKEAELRSEIQHQNKRLANCHKTIARLKNHNVVMKRYAFEFGLAARAVIIDLIQNSLLQKKQTVDQSAQLTDQSATLQRLYEGYQQALKANQDATELVRAQQREHEETTHDLRLKIRELQTEVRVSKKSNRFSEDDE